jgi:exopolysaccharide biosynthesis polyprenyl glycosylphosphotransferase
MRARGAARPLAKGAGWRSPGRRLRWRSGQVEVRLLDLDAGLRHGATQGVVQKRELDAGQLHAASDQQEDEQEQDERPHRRQGTPDWQGIGVHRYRAVCDIRYGCQSCWSGIMPAERITLPMTRRHLMALRLVLMLADGVAAVFVFIAVSALRFNLGGPEAQWSVGFDVATASVFFAAIWVAVLWALGLYRLRVRWSLLAEARDLVRATFVVVAVILSALFLLHQEDVSRIFLALLFIAQPAVSLIERAVLRSWFDVLRRRGYNTNYMLIVGTGPAAQVFADRVEERADLGLHVVGHLTVGRTDAGGTTAGGNADATALTRPLLGRIEEIHHIFQTVTVDEVAVVLPPGSTHLLDAVVSVAAEVGKTVRVPADPEEGLLSHALEEEFEGFLVRSIVHDGHRDLELAAKRVLDIIGASVGLVLLSPVMLAVAVLIWVRDGRPILFRQVRVGRHGRQFTIYKFRTMAPDAEDRFGEVAAQSETKGAAFKMTDDPRITPVGRILRKWTLDELPQLVNVLAGDMSLVGPRPAPPREVAEYDIWHRRRLSVRPGMTGLWQVEARFDEHFDDRAELDLRYIDQWSLWMDIGILVRTLPALLSPRGR